MKRFISTISLVLLCVVAFAQENTKTGIMLENEHKIVVEARRSSMNFDEIEVTNAIRLIVEERNDGNIIVRAPQSVLPFVSLEVKDGTLYARLLACAPVHRNSNLAAEVYIPYNGRIKEIETRSAARVVVKPTLVAEEVDLKASSASTIEVKLSSGELDAELSGASTMELSGAVAKADIEASSASTLHASKLQVTHLELECSSASTAEVSAVIAEVEASSVSTINVECSKQLNASASSGSSINYSGDCQVIKQSSTGASSINKK